MGKCFQIDQLHISSRLWDRYDPDKSGYISPKNLQKLVGELSKNSKNSLSDKQIGEITARLIQVII